MRLRLWFLLVLLASAAAAQPSGTWENASFGPEGAGVGGTLISALVTSPTGDVIASGNFSSIGGTSAERIARWDGSQWYALGAGLDFYASDLAAGPDGAVYAAGVNAVGVAGYGVVRWDGQSWTALGDLSGLPFTRVDDVSVAPDGTVYAGVSTYVPQGDNGYYVGRVIRWTGTEWVPTAPFPSTPPYGSVLVDLAVATDGTLYAARQDAVFRWTGAAWTAICSGQARVLTAGGDGSLYAAGYLDIGGQTTAGVSRWNGSAWTRLGNASDAFSITTLAVGTGGAVYAGGQFSTIGGAAANNVARWDGTAWRPMQSGVGKAAPGNFETVVRALALAPDGTLHAGGRFDTAGGTFSPNLARWRDDAWQSAGGGIDGLVRALTRAADGRPVIAGSFRIAGVQVVNSVAIRQGASWAALGTGPYPTVYASISAVERDRDGDLIACGDALYRWNGTSWSTTAPAAPSSGCYDLARDPQQAVYAATSAVGGGGAVQRWDGDAWTPLGSPGPFTTTVVVAPDGTLYAGGGFGVARYDAGTWVTLGTLGGTAPVVYDLAASPDGTLYAGGRFESVGGVSARNVARWDGTAWHPLGAGTDQTVRALLLDPARGLYAGGDFTAAGGTAASRIALWTGSAWTPLGDGTDGPVNALLADGPDGVLVGGDFARADGTASPYVARWSARPVAAEPPAASVALSLSVLPNPTTSASMLLATHPAGPVTLDVFDTLGRRVIRAFDGDAPAGEHRIPLDVSRLPPGLYVVRLTAAGAVTSVSLTVVR